MDYTVSVDHVLKILKEHFPSADAERVRFAADRIAHDYLNLPKKQSELIRPIETRVESYIDTARQLIDIPYDRRGETMKFEQGSVRIGNRSDENLERWEVEVYYHPYGMVEGKFVGRFQYPFKPTPNDVYALIPTSYESQPWGSGLRWNGSREIPLPSEVKILTERYNQLMENWSVPGLEMVDGDGLPEGFSEYHEQEDR